MRRRALVALLVLALAALVGVTAASSAGADRPSAAALEGELVCPTCKTTLDESDAPIAQRMKAYIRTRIDEGATAQQIKDELVAQFGPGVLSTPPTHGFDLLAWLLPIGGLGVGAVGLGALAWAWSRRRDGGGDDRGQGSPPLDPELERRVDEALAQFEP